MFRLPARSRSETRPKHAQFETFQPLAAQCLIFSVSAACPSPFGNPSKTTHLTTFPPLAAQRMDSHCLKEKILEITSIRSLGNFQNVSYTFRKTSQVLKLAPISKMENPQSLKQANSHQQKPFIRSKGSRSAGCKWSQVVQCSAVWFRIIH